jgi:hypothetical protein
MWNLDLYARLDLADAWVIVGPVNWYAPSSNLKLMFDRLVCANGGNPREELIRHKDPELAMALEKTAEWRALSVNHLEGRTAAFLCYGDGGGDELDEDGRPRILAHEGWFDPREEPFDDMRQTHAPLVWQCRYSGVEVPDPLWRYLEFGRGRAYSQNQAEHMVGDRDLLAAIDDFADAVAAFVAGKGKVEPGRWRAHGYRPPAHRWADARLAWREARMRLGRPRPGSSPERQQALDVNRDVTLRPKRGEGAKRRDD